MRKALKILAPAALMIAGLAITGAEAAPVGSGMGSLKTLPEASSAVEKTHWVRSCHRTRWGHIRCHRVWVSPRRHHHHHNHHHRRHW